MSLRLITESTQEPISVEELKLHLRIATTNVEEEPNLKAYIKAARVNAENYMKRKVIRATYQLNLDCFPADTSIIKIPMPPLSSSATDLTISYTDSTGATQTLSATVYTVDRNLEPSRIYLSYDQDWPTNVRDINDAVRISFISGYASSTDAPENVKMWIKYRAGAMWENREALYDAKIADLRALPFEYLDGLLDPYVADFNV